MKLLLKNGKVYTEKGFIDADLLISNGRIEKILPDIKEMAEPSKVIDCSGKHICPGFIDAHVHFREPGHTHKEDFLSGSKAAAAGGVTTIFDMPNTSPPTVFRDDLEQKRELAKKSLVNYGLYVLGCKDNMNNVGSYKNIPGIKVFLGSSTGNYLTEDMGVFAEILKNSEKPVVVHAENESLIRYFSNKFKESKMHHKMRDNLAAVLSVAEACTLATYLRKRLHITHVSTSEEIDYLRRNKNQYITFEVCPHHLFLDEQFFAKYGNFGKMNPPLRYADDRAELWNAIKEGLVDMITTDHAPHLIEEKQKPFEEAPSGIPGVQTRIPLLLNEASKEKISLMDIVKLCAVNPAKIFGIKNRGELKIGYYADITILDMQKEAPIRNQSQLSKCSWTPFDQVMVKGWPVMTIVNGHVVYNNGMIDDAVKGMEVEF